MKLLTPRQLNEKIFHDTWAASVFPREIFFQEAFESPTAIENHYILLLMGDLTSKRILDLGCGLGDATIYFAQKGAVAEAVDISPEMIELVKHFAKKRGVSKNVKAMVMTAENLQFADESFDFVYGNGVLHHVEFIKVAGEIKRVLKKNGKAFFVEPLSYNPIIGVYRKIANKVRTLDEKPMSFGDIEMFCQGFARSSHKEFHLFTLLIFLWYFLGERVSPNRQRYWKKILIEGNHYSKIFNFLSKLDKIVLKYLPFLSRFYWNTVIVVQK